MQYPPDWIILRIIHNNIYPNDNTSQHLLFTVCHVAHGLSHLILTNPVGVIILNSCRAIIILVLHVRELSSGRLNNLFTRPAPG